MRLRPLHSAAWIRLGLWEESRGNIAKAEQLLLRAAEADRLHLPRWSLANFYHRQGRQAEFARWLAAAFAMSYGDRRALFDLTLRSAQSEAELLRTIPDDAGVRIAYLRHLASVNRIDGAAAIARRVAAEAPPSQSRELAAWTSRLIGAGDIDRANALWSALCERKLAACPNDDFSADATGEGFDWRILHTAAIRTPQGLRLRFDGNQPEHAELLWRWSVAAGPLPRVIADWNPLPGFGWQVERTRPNLVRVVLRYDRPAGQVRYRGDLVIRSARLAP